MYSIAQQASSKLIIDMQCTDNHVLG